MSTSRKDSLNLNEMISSADFLAPDMPDFELAAPEKPAQVITDIRQESETIRQKGLKALTDKQLPEAIAHFKQAVALRESDLTLTLGADYLFIGDCYQGLGCSVEANPTEAIHFYSRGIAAYEQVTEEDRHLIPNFYLIMYEYFYSNIVANYCEKKTPEIALSNLKAFSAKLTADQHIEDPAKIRRLLALDYERIALCFHEQKQLEQEEGCFKEALHCLETISLFEEEDHYLKHRLWQNYGEIQFARVQGVAERLQAYRQAAQCLEPLVFKYESDRFYRVSYEFYARFSKLLQFTNNTKELIDITKLALLALEKLGKRRIREEWINLALVSLTLSEVSNDALEHIGRVKENLKQLIDYLVPKYDYATYGNFFGEKQQEYYTKLMAWHYRLGLRTEGEERAKHLEQCYKVTKLPGCPATHEQVEQISVLLIEVYEALKVPRLLRDHLIERAERHRLFGDYITATKLYFRAKQLIKGLDRVTNADIEKQEFINKTMHNLHTLYKEEQALLEISQQVTQPPVAAETVVQLKQELKALQEEVKQLRTELAELPSRKRKEAMPTLKDNANTFFPDKPSEPQAKRSGLRSAKKLGP